MGDLERFEQVWEMFERFQEAPVVVEIRHYREMRVDNWPLHYKGEWAVGAIGPEFNYSVQC